MAVHGRTTGRAGWRVITLAAALLVATTTLVVIHNVSSASSEVVSATLTSGRGLVRREHARRTRTSAPTRDSSPTRRRSGRASCASTSPRSPARSRTRASASTSRTSPTRGARPAASSRGSPRRRGPRTGSRTTTGRPVGVRPSRPWAAVKRNTWVEVPVTSAVTTGGVLTLGLRSTNDDGAYYDSREARRERAPAHRHDAHPATRRAPPARRARPTPRAPAPPPSTSSSTEHQLEHEHELHHHHDRHVDDNDDHHHAAAARRLGRERGRSRRHGLQGRQLGVVLELPPARGVEPHRQRPEQPALPRAG